MARYSLGLNTTVTTNAAAAWGFLAPSDTNPIITELIITNGAATATEYGFGRAAAAGTQTGGISVQPDHPSNATSGKSTCAVAWSAAPTVPTQFLRRINIAGVIGEPAILVFPEGITVAASGEMVLWNLQANTADANINVSCIE
jgi:hypothetical protein